MFQHPRFVFQPSGSAGLEEPLRAGLSSRRAQPKPGFARLGCCSNSSTIPQFLGRNSADSPQVLFTKGRNIRVCPQRSPERGQVSFDRSYFGLSLSPDFVTFLKETQPGRGCKELSFQNIENDGFESMLSLGRAGSSQHSCGY